MRILNIQKYSNHIFHTFLKNQFQNPYTNADDIKNMQDALKAIIAEPAKFTVPFSKELMDSIDVYYFSKRAQIIIFHPKK